jgi:uncharacterized membrane protein YgcG
MAERLRSAIETLFNVRDEANALAPSADERRRRRNEFIETLRSYGVPILFVLVAAVVIAVAIHFVVWSLVAYVVMPLIYAGVPDLEKIAVGAGSSVALGQFIAYLLYAACMIGLATLALRGVLAKPSGYVRQRTRICPSCGMSVPDVATKCRFCGSSLPARRAYGSTTPSRGPAPALSSSRRSSDEGSDAGHRPSRRGRRGGRRRGGRGRPRPGSGPGPAPSGSEAGSSRPANSGRPNGGRTSG